MKYKSYQAVFNLSTAIAGVYQARYSKFHIGDESTNFRLSVDGFSGKAGDALRSETFNWSADGQAFSTPDRDHDSAPGESCAVGQKSGWWFRKCSESNVNGPCWNQPGYNTAERHAMLWRPISWNRALTFSEIKVKPSQSMTTIKVFPP